MEEQRANGAPIDDDAINSVKSGLMGPMAGHRRHAQPEHDHADPARPRHRHRRRNRQRQRPSRRSPARPAIRSARSSTRSWSRPSIIGIGYMAWMQGYARGRAFVTDLLRSGTIDRVLVGAGVLGNLVLGALAAKFVVVYLAPTVTIAGASSTCRRPPRPDLPGSAAARTGRDDLVAAAGRVSPLGSAGGLPGALDRRGLPFFGPGHVDRPRRRRNTRSARRPCSIPTTRAAHRPRRRPRPSHRRKTAPARGGSAGAARN